eukprot:9354361-Pyramimonas_sp.AAC.1
MPAAALPGPRRSVGEPTRWSPPNTSRTHGTAMLRASRGTPGRRRGALLEREGGISGRPEACVERFGS